MKKSFFLLVIMVVFFLGSCKKDDVQPPAKQKPQTMDELVASPNFNWKTTKEYQFVLKGNYNSIVKITAQSGTLYHKAILKANTVYAIKVTLPSYEKKVRLQYLGNDVEVNLTQATINYNFN